MTTILNSRDLWKDTETRYLHLLMGLVPSQAALKISDRKASVTGLVGGWSSGLLITILPLCPLRLDVGAVAHLV